jgi:GT2 family glycosyltransferase
LLSVRHLAFQDFHLIIADDSADNESEIITEEIFPESEYFKNVPPLREIKNSNKIISMAKTDIVCLFHDDDVFNVDYFNEIVLAMENDKEIDIAYTGRVMVNQNDEKIGKQVLSDQKEGGNIIFYARDILDYMLFGKKILNYRVFVNTPGLVFRKRIFEEIGGFDLGIDTHCDTDFLLKALLVSRKVLFVNKALYVNKIWYGVSGRTKSSERGVVFDAQKGVLDSFIAFCEKRGNTYYPSLRKQIYSKFAFRCTRMNGPLGWISIRFKGNYFLKVTALWETTCKIVRMDPKTLFFPRFYFVFFGAVLTPKFVQNFIMKFLLKAYNRKA